MTIPLQPTRDSSTVQSRTAPAREPLRPTGLRHPEAKQVRTVSAFGTRAPRYRASLPNTTFHIAPEMPPGHFTWVSAPRFPAHPQRQSCPRVQTGARSGLRRLRLPEIGVISYGPALEGMRLLLQRRSRSLLASFFPAEQPTRRKSSFLKSFKSFRESLTLKGSGDLCPKASGVRGMAGTPRNAWRLRTSTG